MSDSTANPTVSVLPAERGMSFAEFEGDLDEKLHVLLPSSTWAAQDGRATEAKCGYAGHVAKVYIRPVRYTSVCEACVALGGIRVVS